MNISEIIEHLTKIKDTYGDLSVRVGSMSSMPNEFSKLEVVPSSRFDDECPEGKYVLAD